MSGEGTQAYRAKADPNRDLLTTFGGPRFKYKEWSESRWFLYHIRGFSPSISASYAHGVKIGPDQDRAFSLNRIVDLAKHAIHNNNATYEASGWLKRVQKKRSTHVEKNLTSSHGPLRSHSWLGSRKRGACRNTPTPRSTASFST